jgi:hypothetical protein
VAPPVHDAPAPQVSAGGGLPAEGGLPAAFAAAVLSAAPQVFQPQAAQAPAVVAAADGGAGVMHTSMTDGVAALGSSGGTSGDVLPVDLMHYADYGWHVVPSTANQYGEAVPTGEAGYEFAADFVPKDWLYV